jgi:hypothetical protein
LKAMSFLKLGHHVRHAAGTRGLDKPRKPVVWVVDGPGLK